MRTIADILRSHAVLDENGKHIGGSDKMSNHFYGPAYDSLFPDRNAINLVMEVGITDGSSMLAWREAFQRAHIVGLDIMPCSCERGPRLEFHIGDQRNKEECERAAAGRMFDVIIEDAFHSTDNTLMTLFWLYPFVKPGGMYIVEEWHNIASCRANVSQLFPNAEIVDTQGPFGGIEPLVVIRKAVS